MEKNLHYSSMAEELPETNLGWPLFGDGIDNLGKDGKPVARKFPDYSADELIMRINAVSLCFSDLKEIEKGKKHPRFSGRDLATDPVVPGHEVSFTVAAVGKNLEKEYKVGDRFTLEPDVWFEGKSIPFCFVLDGGYEQYVKIDHRILNGDAGNYLIPVPDDMSCAASAITEPWACVEAAYRAEYRSSLLKNGRTLMVGCGSSRKGYQIDKLLKGVNIPAEVYACDIPGDLQEKVEKLCESSKIKFSVLNRASPKNLELKFEDIILLDLPVDEINDLSQLMEKFGCLSILSAPRTSELIKVDLGRLHYDTIYFNGTTTLDIDQAYKGTAPRSNLKSGGTTWIVGAGGPMGRMHLQRAIEDPSGPSVIIADEVTADRYKALNVFMDMAAKNGKKLTILNSKDEPEKFKVEMDRLLKAGGIDDIVLMVAIPSVVVNASRYIAKQGVMNVFAGLERGTIAEIDPATIYGPMQIRWISHSGSGLDDQKEVVKKAIEKKLRPEFSVAAIGGFNQIPEGLRAMKNATFAGKIVIFPHVPDFPLTSLEDLKTKLPEVYAALGEGHIWTKEAENKFIASVNR